MPKCPEPNCNWCVTGQAKRPARRKERHEARHLIRKEREDEADDA